MADNPSRRAGIIGELEHHGFASRVGSPKRMLRTLTANGGRPPVPLAWPAVWWSACAGYGDGVGDEEFEEHAAAVADSVDDHDLDLRIAAACRGSGNPAGLAWLAEGLRLQPGRCVVDLGSGLGGPAAWLERHYRCRMVGVEPAPASVEGAAHLFGTPVVRSTASATPFPSGAFDVALLLGVLSVVPDPAASLNEAKRLAEGLGVLEWCSTEVGIVEAGGSRFPRTEELDRVVEQSGWSIIQAAPLDLPVPIPWDEAAPDLDDPPNDERDVSAAISAGRLRVRLLIAIR